MDTQRPTPPQNLGSRHQPQDLTPMSSGHCPGLFAGILSPSIDPGWPSCASFPFWWQTRSSPCKQLDYAAPCILGCCSFYLEFTSLADSIVTNELHAIALKLLKTDLFHVHWTGSASH